MLHIYLDESGDLGWKFDAPYRYGGSSRHLTIASLAVTYEQRHIPKRVIKKLYKKFNWDPEVEKKWSQMNPEERLYFASQATDIAQKNPATIKYFSITTKKENVAEHIRQDPNKLYNYMIGLSLLNEMKDHAEVDFYPDPRSVKVQSGNSLHDYIQTKLWFDKGSKTVIKTRSLDSSSSKNIQFSDMLSGIVQGHYENGNSLPWSKIQSSITHKPLFF